MATSPSRPSTLSRASSHGVRLRYGFGQVTGGHVGVSLEFSVQRAGTEPSVPASSRGLQMRYRRFQSDNHGRPDVKGRPAHLRHLKLLCALGSVGVVIAAANAPTALRSLEWRASSDATAATLSIAASSADITGTSASNSAAKHYCASFVNHLARDLRVSPERLQGAVTRAATETIDDAVAKGDLTKKQASSLKSYVAGRPVCSLGRQGGESVSGPSPTAGRSVTNHPPMAGREV
jgi:hypothetical protein